MTLLETLIRAQVHQSLVTTVNRTTDRIADKMAEDILKDREFREHMQRLIKAAFLDALKTLPQEVPEE